MSTLTVDVMDTKGKKAGTADLPAEVFDVQTNIPLIHQVVVAQLAAARQGTHSTKTRGEVSGGGKKPWRQKGTGRARAGSNRSPIWVGGGVVFGPKPRDYSKKINSRVKALAFSRALYDRALAGEIAVIEQFLVDQPKTKLMNTVVSRIAPKGKILLVDAPFSAEAARAARNIDRVSLQEAAELNTLDLARYGKIIVSTSAIELIIARANGGKN